MKVLLAGHEGSKFLLPASAYLAKKYFPEWFDISYLNFGEKPDGMPKGVEYIAMDAEQKGGAGAWSSYIRKHLGGLNESLVIFGLDDYLLSEEVDIEKVRLIGKRMIMDNQIVCGRLCQSDCFPAADMDIDAEGVLTLKPITYTATAQYCIWRREFLIDLLGKVSTPWQFEMAGSAYLNEAKKKTIGTVKPAMIYNDNSALSSKWTGIDWAGVKFEDRAEIEEKGLIHA